MWAVSSLATECIQVYCLEETHLENIIPPLTIVHIGNGFCEGYSTNICMPSKADLISEIDTPIRCEFFIGFNAIYQNMALHDICYELQLETLTPEEKSLLGIKQSEFPPKALNHLSKQIWIIATDYPWSVPPNAVLAGLVIFSLLDCAAFIFSLWCIRQLHS